MNGRIRKAMGGPNIVIGFGAGLVDLTEEKWLVTLRVKHDIERTGGHALDITIKAGLQG
jgi:hypothetical protein